MDGNPVNDGGGDARSGAQTLKLLSTPLISLLLEALSRGTKQQLEMRAETGYPAQTTLRAQLKRLHDIGALEKNRSNAFPGAIDYRLTKAGDELIDVARHIDDWLAEAPHGPTHLGTDVAKAALAALTGAWSTSILHVLAATPLSLTELNRVISSLSYPSLERRLAALRLAAQVAPVPRSERGTPQALTDWGRKGVGPIAAAARWERRHMPKRRATFGPSEAETLFLLAAPLLRVETNLSGICRIASETPGSNEQRLANVVLQFEHGQVSSYAPRRHGNADAWALGPSAVWLDALVAADVARIEVGGDSQLAHAVLDSLHRMLAGPPVEARS